MPYLTLICRRVQELRLRRNLTQKAMATYLGISLRAYNNIENGRTDIGIRKLEKICKELNITLHDLLNIEKSIEEILAEQFYHNTPPAEIVN